MKNKKQTLLLTVTNDLTYDQRMIRICTCLAEQGYEVGLIGRKKEDSQTLIDRPFRQKRLRCFFEKGKFFYLEFNLRLFFYLLWRNCDGICAIDLDTILPAYFVSKLRRKVMIYDAHEYFTEVPEVVRRPRIKAIWEKVANWSLPNIRYNYTVGPQLAQLFEKKYQQKYSVIRNVPFSRPPSEIQIKTDFSTIILLYQGALNEGRGLECLIDCMDILPDHYHLKLAGEGDLSQSLRDRAQKSKSHSRISFLGYLPPEQLQQITPQAHLGFNLLENSGLSYYYSLANKCFDYIQAGIPSINMNFPEYKALNEQYQTFVLVDELDPFHISGAIQTLFANSNQYQAIIDNCKKAAQELNWEREQERLIDFYRAIL